MKIQTIEYGLNDTIRIKKKEALVIPYSYKFLNDFDTQNDFGKNCFTKSWSFGTIPIMGILTPKKLGQSYFKIVGKSMVSELGKYFVFWQFREPWNLKKTFLDDISFRLKSLKIIAAQSAKAKRGGSHYWIIYQQDNGAERVVRGQEFGLDFENAISMQNLELCVARGMEEGM